MKNRELWKGGDSEYVFHIVYGEPIYYSYPTQWWDRFIKRHGLRHSGIKAANRFPLKIKKALISQGL